MLSSVGLDVPGLSELLGPGTNLQQAGAQKRDHRCGTWGLQGALSWSVARVMICSTLHRWSAQTDRCA